MWYRPKVLDITWLPSTTDEERQQVLAAMHGIDLEKMEVVDNKEFCESIFK